MNNEKGGIVLAFNDISVKCCKCYVDYWKSIRKLKGSNTVEHDSSIEKVKTFRKYFPEDKLLLYFCIECFQRVLVSIPLSDVVSEMLHRSRGGCVGYFLINEKFCDEICDTCIMFIVEKFGNDFVTV